MKKIYRLLFGFFVVFFITFLFPPKQSFAYGPIPEVTIDGIIYEIIGNHVQARIGGVDSTQEEVYVRNQIEYKGKTYRVSDFYDRLERDYGSTHGWKKNLFPDLGEDAGCYHYRKITIEKGVAFNADMINFLNLEEIVFEDSADLKYIALYNCPKLKNLYIPKEYTGQSPDIKECPNITITVDADNPKYKVINNDIYSKNGKVLYNVTGGPSNYRIAKSVTQIYKRAFNGNQQIKTVYMPNNVKKMGSNVFANMDNLTSVRFSKSLKNLGKHAFYCTPKVKKIILPKSVTNIDGGFGGEFGWNQLCQLKKITLRAKS